MMNQQCQWILWWCTDEFCLMTGRCQLVFVMMNDSVSCVQIQLLVDYNPVCYNSDGDGVCDEWEIIGCTDVQACY